MAQRVAYATLPGISPMAWHAILVPLLAEVDRARPGLRALKEWLRVRSLFDRDGFETLLAFLDVRLGEPVTLGPVARALLDAGDEPTARVALADRLVGENPLLAKYCLEALDVDRGGRLHSTNELYRMVTSYVYPGDKPTLPAFKAWVDWAVAANLMKLVGIRWALGETGRGLLPRMRALDAEEFLEDEREAAGKVGQSPFSAAADGAENGASLHLSAPSQPTPLPQSPPPLGAQPALPENGASLHFSSSPSGVPVAVVEIGVCPHFPPPVAGDLAGTRDALVGWYARWPERVPSPWPCLDLADGDAGVFEAAVVALWIARGMPGSDAARVLAALRNSGVLARAGDGTLTLAALAATASGSPDPAMAPALEAAALLPRLHSGAREPGLLDAAMPRDLLVRLWNGLYAPGTPLAPFVLARLLLVNGRLPDALAPAALVPTFTVRENAFRIGFLARLHAASFDDLVDSALALSAGFGAPGLEEPLAHVHEAFGCAFRCSRVAVCPLACRERTEVAAGPRP